MYGLTLTLASFFGPKIFSWTFPYKETHFALKSHSIVVILEGLKGGVIDVSIVWLLRSADKIKGLFHFELFLWSGSDQNQEQSDWNNRRCPHYGSWRCGFNELGAAILSQAPEQSPQPR